MPDLAEQVSCRADEQQIEQQLHHRKRRQPKQPSKNSRQARIDAVGIPISKARHQPGGSLQGRGGSGQPSSCYEKGAVPTAAPDVRRDPPFSFVPYLHAPILSTPRIPFCSPPGILRSPRLSGDASSSASARRMARSRYARLLWRIPPHGPDAGCWPL